MGPNLPAGELARRPAAARRARSVDVRHGAAQRPPVRQLQPDVHPQGHAAAAAGAGRRARHRCRDASDAGRGGSTPDGESGASCLPGRQAVRPAAIATEHPRRREASGVTRGRI